MPNSRSQTLAVVVPATDRPPTLARCVAALRGLERAAGRAGRRRASRRAPGRRRRATPGSPRPPATWSRSSTPTSWSRPTRSRGCARGSPPTPASRPSSALRRRAGGAGDGLAVSQPAPPPRPRLARRARPRPSGPGSAPCAAMRSSAAGGFDAERFAEAGGRGHRARHAPARAPARSIVLDPAVRGTHLKRWSLRSMVGTDLRRRGVPWTRLQLEARRALGLRSTSAGATGSARSPPWSRRSRPLARRPRAAARRRSAALVALNPRFYALLAPPRRRRAGGRRRRPAHRPPPDRRASPSALGVGRARLRGRRARGAGERRAAARCASG